MIMKGSVLENMTDSEVQNFIAGIDPNKTPSRELSLSSQISGICDVRKRDRYLRSTDNQCATFKECPKDCRDEGTDVTFTDYYNSSKQGKTCFSRFYPPLKPSETPGACFHMRAKFVMFLVLVIILYFFSAWIVSLVYGEDRPSDAPFKTTAETMGSLAFSLLGSVAIWFMADYIRSFSFVTLITAVITAPIYILTRKRFIDFSPNQPEDEQFLDKSLITITMVLAGFFIFWEFYLYSTEGTRSGFIFVLIGWGIFYAVVLGVSWGSQDDLGEDKSQWIYPWLLALTFASLFRHRNVISNVASGIGLGIFISDVAALTPVMELTRPK